MYLKLNLLKLKEVFQYFMTKFIHSCIHGKNHILFQEYFSNFLPSHTYNTRNLKLNYSCFKLEVEKHLSVYNCIRLYNELPSDLFEPQTPYKHWTLCFPKIPYFNPI